MIEYLGENKLLTLILLVPLVLAFIVGIAIGAKGPAVSSRRGRWELPGSGCLTEIFGFLWFAAVIYAIAEGGVPELGEIGVWYAAFYLLSYGALQVLVLMGLYEFGRLGGRVAYRLKVGKGTPPDNAE